MIRLLDFSKMTEKINFAFITAMNEKIENNSNVKKIPSQKLGINDQGKISKEA